MREHLSLAYANMLGDIQEPSALAGVVPANPTGLNQPQLNQLNIAP
jgi:hypothetical protein